LRAAAEDDRAKAEIRLRELDATFGKFLATLGTYVKVNESGHLEDLNQWVDILLPHMPSDSVQMAAARSSLAAILPSISPLASQQGGLFTGAGE